MQNQGEILRQLGEILQEQGSAGLAALGAEQRLQEDLGLDSLGLLAFAVEVENRFRIHLNEDPAAPPRTLGDLAKLVAERLTESGG